MKRSGLSNLTIAIHLDNFASLRGDPINVEGSITILPICAFKLFDIVRK